MLKVFGRILNDSTNPRWVGVSSEARRHIGELRQRWEDIKKLHHFPEDYMKDG